MTTNLTTLFSIITLLSLFTACSAESGEKKLIAKDDFDKDLSHWVVEQMAGGTTKVADGKLVIEDAKGCTVWF